MKKYRYCYAILSSAFIIQANLFSTIDRVNAAEVPEKYKSIQLKGNASVNFTLLDNEKDTEWNERYFRPSKYKSINNKAFGFEFFDQYRDKKVSEINLPKNLFLNPKDTILNYFSILREANNMSNGREAGCGTIGEESAPYPIAYNFFTDNYKRKVNYEEYYNKFKGISHINLLKLESMGVSGRVPETLKYFIELETIEPTEKKTTNFGYYYGYIYLNKDRGSYKISDIELSGEDFLCAPYHGWRHNAEFYVSTVYGNWCKLINKVYPTEQVGYIKNIKISGTDGKEYLFKFAQLTNGVDIEIGQYEKAANNEWKAIKIDVDKCLEKMRSKDN